MKCPKCSHENEEGAKFCSHCGMNLNDQKDWPSILLLAWSGSMLFFAIVYAILAYLLKSPDVNSHLVIFVAAIFGIANALAAILVPLGISKMPLKMSAFAFVIIAILIEVAILVQTIVEVATN